MWSFDSNKNPPVSLCQGLGKQNHGDFESSNIKHSSLCSLSTTPKLHLTVSLIKDCLMDKDGSPDISFHHTEMTFDSDKVIYV